MAHDVFIAHASEDRVTATAICAGLEARGIRCWIAPRDVPPGREYSEVIIEAIQGSRVLVLLFSGHANSSPYVKRELEQAANHELPILPFRIQSVEMSKTLRFFVGAHHWLDALTPPLAQHIELLGDSVAALLAPRAGAARARASRDAREPSAEPATSRGRAKGRLRLALVLALAASAAVGYLALRPSSPGARPARGFATTGSLVAGGRGNFAAVRLRDGRVFVVGGAREPGGESKGTAEVYDESLGTWALAGAMAVPRSYLTANLLPDGRVLVVGGASLAGVTSSTELWDPATGRFTRGPSMAARRFAHTAVGLADGRLLVAGGHATTDNPTAQESAEIYTPTSNTWTATGPLRSPLANHAAVLLADGRVLVAGGDDGVRSRVPGKGETGYVGNSICQVYDPHAGTFALVHPMRRPRANFAMVTLADGGVLVIGGNLHTAGEDSQIADLYDPVKDRWSFAGTTTCGGGGPTLTLLADGGAVATGGAHKDVYLTNADYFDPSTRHFSPLPPMKVGRQGHTATLLASGSVLIAGGNDGSPFLNVTSAAELFSPGAVPPR